MTNKAEVTTPANIEETASLDDARNVYIYQSPDRIKLSKATGKTAVERPLVFELTAAATRYTVTAAVARAWLGTLDIEERAAMLSGAGSIETSSAVRPAGDLWDEAKGLFAEAAFAHGVETVDILRGLLADGFLVVPAKERADRAAKAATDNTDAVLAELFA